MLDSSAFYPCCPAAGVTYRADRIVEPKPPKARPGRYSESRRHQRNDPPSISPDSEEFFARSRSSSTDTFPTCSNQRAHTRAQVHPPLRSGFFMPSGLHVRWQESEHLLEGTRPMSRHITLDRISYAHPSQPPLFADLSAVFSAPSDRAYRR